MSDAPLPHEHTGESISFRSGTSEGATGLVEEGLRNGLFSAREQNASAAAILDGFQLTRPQLSDTAPAEQRAEFIKQPENRAPVSIGHLWDRESRVLAIGDYHMSDAVKEHMQTHMPPPLARPF